MTQIWLPSTSSLFVWCALRRLSAHYWWSRGWSGTSRGTLHTPVARLCAFRATAVYVASDGHQAPSAHCTWRGVAQVVVCSFHCPCFHERRRSRSRMTVLAIVAWSHPYIASDRVGCSVAARRRWPEREGASNEQFWAISERAWVCSATVFIADGPQ